MVGVERLNSDAPLKVSNNLESSSDRQVLRFIHLKSSVTIPNFISYLICVFFSIVFVVYINSTQAFLLGYKLGISEGLGDITGTLSLADEILSLVCVCIWGIVSDRLGRRIVFSLGFVIVGLSLFLFTVPTQVFPDLLLVRLVFAIGASACTSMLTAGLADVVGKKNHVTSGVVGMFSGLGAIIAVFLLLPIPGWLTKKVATQSEAIVISLYIVGSIAIVWGIITFFTYQKQLPIRHDNEKTIRMEIFDSFHKFPKALAYFGKDLKIAMGYLSGFVARGDTVILTSFISLWVVKFYLDNGMCNPDVHNFTSEDGDRAKETCPKAYSLAMALSGIAQVFALVGAPIVGFLLVRVKANIVLFLSSLLGAVGYFGFGFSTNPTNKIVYLFVCLLGIGEIGTIVTSLSFLSEPETIPVELRGTISGIYSLFGGLGIIVSSKLGGYLFDVWRPGAPFIIMGIFHVVLMVMAVAAYLFERRNNPNTSVSNQEAFTS